MTICGNDVSLRYVDLKARLTNAEAQRNAMLALLQHARSVSDTIQIQNQLGQVTGRIEELKGQISFLDHSTTYATVSVAIRETTTSPRDEWGLQSAASQTTHKLVTLIAFLILVFGTLAPFLALGFGIGFAAWRVLLRYRRHHALRPAAGTIPPSNPFRYQVVRAKSCLNAPPGCVRVHNQWRCSWERWR